jgi:hypothetical protein
LLWLLYSNIPLNYCDECCQVHWLLGTCVFSKLKGWIHSHMGFQKKEKGL